MEHMRMDPKHQFAAQYVLSRAAAERRKRETLLAAVSASAQSSSLLGLAGMGPGKFLQCCHNKKVHIQCGFKRVSNYKSALYRVAN